MKKITELTEQRYLTRYKKDEFGSILTLGQLRVNHHQALIFFMVFVFYFPNILNHPDNYIEADPLETPAHVVPE